MLVSRPPPQPCCILERPIPDSASDHTQSGTQVYTSRKSPLFALYSRLSSADAALAGPAKQREHAQRRARVEQNAAVIFQRAWKKKKQQTTMARALSAPAASTAVVEAAVTKSTMTTQTASTKATTTTMATMTSAAADGGDSAIDIASGFATLRPREVSGT